MINKLKTYGKAIAGSLLALTALVLPSVSFAQYTPAPLDEEGAIDIIADMVSTVSNMLGGTLPIIFGVIALLIGVFFVFKQVQKRIGRAR